MSWFCFIFGHRYDAGQVLAQRRPICCLNCGKVLLEKGEGLPRFSRTWNAKPEEPADDPRDFKYKA
jgi:hypothetical protein